MKILITLGRIYSIKGRYSISSYNTIKAELDRLELSKQIAKHINNKV